MTKNRSVSLYCAFKEGVKIGGDNPCLIYLNKKISFKDMDSKVSCAARALKAAGVKKGDVVTLCLPNIPAAATLIYAVNAIGGVISLIHAMSSSEKIEKSLKSTGSRFLFILSAFAYESAAPLLVKNRGLTVVCCDAAEELPFIKRGVYYSRNTAVLSPLFGLIKSGNYRIMTFTDFVVSYSNSEGAIAGFEADKDPHGTAVLIDSGGTGGEPKTVEVSDYAINSQCSAGLSILNLESVVNKFMLSPLPFFHSFGLSMGLHAMVWHGGCNVIMPQFHKKDVLKYIAKKQVNFMIGIPAVYSAILSHEKFKGNKLKSLYIAFVGGDFTSENLLENFNKRLIQSGSVCRLFEGYGLTETMSVCAVNTHVSNRSGSLGKPIDGVEIKAFDTGNFTELLQSDAGKSKAGAIPVKRFSDAPFVLESGTDGELCVSGDTLCTGYFNDKTATENTFFTDEKGVKWLKTGDYGYVDNDGFVYLKQRIKRIIKVSGVTVFPSEIEAAAMKIKGLTGCCAIGIEDEKKGHRVCLAVTPLPRNEEEKRREILLKLSDVLCPEAVPRHVHFLDKLPLTPINKTDVNKLKELLKH